MKLLLMKLSEKLKDRLTKYGRMLIQVAIIGYLLYQLYQIGLPALIDSLPTNPLFYLLYLLIYFSLPLAEIFIYKLKWEMSWKAGFPVFIQKKVLNTDVVGYSGELYLYHWARKTLGIPTREAIKYIKDNNVLSSLASTLITLILLYYFITQGYIDIGEYIQGIDAGLWTGIVLGGGIIAFLIYHFRHYIIHINRRDAVKVFLLHAFRIVFINVIQILQWEVARPEITLAVWFSLSAVQIISSRIPFLPSTDALFVTVALEVSGLVEVPKELLAGILTANLVLKRVLNVTTYSAANLFRQELPESELESEKKEFEQAD